MHGNKLHAFYIDLFDDGIPKINVLTENISQSLVEKNLLDAARFQILLAILFERQVAIPESWAISSPTFLRIFSEIKNAYSDIVDREDSAGAVAKAALKPFVFCFFSDIHNSPTEAYLTAFIRRLEEGKRVQCLTALDPASPLLDERARIYIADYFKRLIHSLVTTPNIEYKKFRDDLSNVIYDGFDGAIDIYKGSSVAFAISDVVEYLNDQFVIKETQFWQNAEGEIHRNTVKEIVLRVHQSLNDEYGLGELYPFQAQEFRKFFIEASRKNVAISDVMGMWKILQNYDREVKETIEAFGRYALNRGYGKATGAAQNTLSFDYYCYGSPSKFAYAMLGKIAKIEQDFDPLNTSFSQFFEMASSQSYDLDHTIEWKNAWRSAATIASSQRWKEKRGKIERNFFEMRQKNQDISIEDWHELFDEINAGFQDLTFQIVGGELPSVKLLKKATSSYETDVSEIANIGLKSLNIFIHKIFEFIPTKLVLKGIRKLNEVNITQKGTKLISRV